MANNPTSGIVLTGQQEAWTAGGGPGKYWEEKPNAGYSGTPLWKLHAERAALLAEAGNDAVKIPDGFVKHDSEWYWSEKRQVFWNAKSGDFWVWDPIHQTRTKLYEAQNFEISVAVGGMCHERASQVKHVIVRDLAKAAQALRMSIEHLDRPCALYALYEGHRGSASNTCTDFCARHLHGKLLPRLAAFRGYWEDDRLATAMRESFEELDANFAEKNPGVNDGCCAAVALITGSRLVVASLGDVACTLCLRTGETTRLVPAHAIPDPDTDEDEDEEDDAAAEVPDAPSPPIRWSRSFGDFDLKERTPQAQASSGSSGHRISAEPEVKVLHLQHNHHGFAFICRALYASIGGRTAVSTVFRRSAGRPRMASGALVDAAVQWLGQVGPDCGLGSIVAFFDKMDSSEEPRVKRAKTDTTQVRLRHILLKHRECKGTVDKVRNKQVKRTRGEAERLLRAVLEECGGERDLKLFTQRCREVSECQSCLKAGELAGDLGWVKRGAGSLGEVFEAAAFALNINQISDLVDSDQGIHVILRSA